MKRYPARVASEVSKNELRDSYSTKVFGRIDVGGKL